MNGRQGIGQRENALKSAKDIESAMVIFQLLAVCLLFPDDCLALRHNLSRVDGEEVMVSEVKTIVYDRA